MAVLQDFFDALAYSEFSDLAMGNSQNGSLQEKEYPKVISALNLALNDMYRKFLLKVGVLYLREVKNQTIYYLRPEFVDDIGGLDTYILYDEENPFLGDLVKILAIYDQENNELPFNQPLDIFPFGSKIVTTSFDVIHIEPQVVPRTLRIVYHATYPKIVLTPTFNPMQYPVYFPDYIQPALLAYVGSRIFRGRAAKGNEQGQSINFTLYRQYDKICEELRNAGLVEDVYLPSDRFTRNGWR